MHGRLFYSLTINHVSMVKHMRIQIISNYLNFIEKVKSSEKRILRQLYSLCSGDCRTVTGSNLRNILLMTSSSSIEKLSPSAVSEMAYKDLSQNDEWKIGLIHEIIDIRMGDRLLEQWDVDELDAILEDICTK